MISQRGTPMIFRQKECFFYCEPAFCFSLTANGTFASPLTFCGVKRGRKLLSLQPINLFSIQKIEQLCTINHFYGLWSAPSSFHLFSPSSRFWCWRPMICSFFPWSRTASLNHDAFKKTNLTKNHRGTPL